MAGPKFNQNVHTFEELEKKYDAFMGPAFQVLIQGSDLAEKHFVSEVEVETSIGPQANTFRFSVATTSDPETPEFQSLYDALTLGTYAEIKMGYMDKLESLIYGIITSVTCELSPDSGYHFLVHGMDVSFLMMRGIKSRSWEGKKYSDIVREIAAAYVSQIIADDTAEEIGIVVQRECSDYQMLKEIAELTNSDMFIIGRTLYFRGALKGTVPVITLKWGESLSGLSIEMNLASQVSGIVIRGWDMQNLTMIEAASLPVNKLSSNSRTGSDIMKGLGGGFDEYIYTNVDSIQEAQEQANAIMNRRSMELVRGEGQCVGIPELQAARYVKLEGLGKNLSQVYYLYEAVHTMDSSGYTVRFRIGGNAI
ncbi:phage protein D [Paenibacillus mucilaginosus]|uniref:phage late control D family protein n=1 Tax=Paenibacillus mucilaginosus TaxID=61624 RepID=UPI003D21C609